jgi:uncharacterized repeat protein (TIGR01451 family)
LTDEIDTGASSQPKARMAEPAAAPEEEPLPELDFQNGFPKRTSTEQPQSDASADSLLSSEPDLEPASNPFAPAAEKDAFGGASEKSPLADPSFDESSRSIRRQEPNRPEHRRLAPVGPDEAAASSANPLRSQTVSEASHPVHATAGVTAEWVKKSDITIGQECACELVVKNQTGMDVADVEVTATLPATVDLVSANPAPQAGGMVWQLGALAAGESRNIELRLVPHERGRMDAQAFVRFSNVAATQTFSVAEPLLAIELSGPSEVMVGDSASQTVTIRNPGTGVATNVTVEAMIPEGLEHARGKRLVMDLGALNPGESRPVRLALAAINGGTHVVEVKAHADGDLVQVANSEVAVIAPQLKAAIQGPSLRYLGRQAVYTLMVSNAGGAGTDNVRVMHKIPEGFEFVSCDKGGRYDSSTRLLNWFVGAMGENDTAEAHVTLKAEQAGSFTHFIRATSEHGIVSDAQVTTQVEGTASLVLRVTDLDDPVEIGAETAYEVKVTNEGTAAAQGVGLTCELPEAVTFTSANGPSEHEQRGRTVTFRPMAQLAPGESAKFQVFVRGQSAGNLRFRANLTSESVVEPLTAEELTKVYGE